jgi:hypothetical protein
MTVLTAAQASGDVDVVIRLARTLVANGELDAAAGRGRAGLGRPDVAPASRTALSVLEAGGAGARR